MRRLVKRVGLRGRLTAIVFLAAAATLTALTAGFNLALRSSLHHDADQVLVGRASAAIDTLRVGAGRIRAVESPDQRAVDAQVWVFSGRRVIERPPVAPVAPVVDRAASLLAGGPRAHLEEPSTDTRLYAVPVVRGGSRVGTVVAGLSLEPYERTASQALVGSLIFAGVVLLLIAVAVRWVVGSALRPVARMTADAEAWSELELDRRFNAGEPYDEITRLAATLDRMLDRLAASLRREQRFSAELSHELRTPLSAIAAEAELALRRQRSPGEYRDALQAIAKRAKQLERTLETLLTAARAESGIAHGTADAVAVAEHAIESCAALARSNGVRVDLVRPRSPLRVGVELDAGERVLVPILENACRYGRSRATVEVAGADGTVDFLVSDDGPGIDPSERERVFEPGERGNAAAVADDNGGAGLGLALARRVAIALGAEVECLEADSGGRFRIRMPVG
jgi:signal transduction histidine kinase